MARTKTKKSTDKVAKAKTVFHDRKERVIGWFSQFKWGDSYTSLLLGIIVVIVAVVLVVSFARNRNTEQPTVTQPQAEETNEITSLENISTEDLPATYTVKEGDDLWTIAEAVYKSGFNWTDIAQANNLENPGDIEAGMKLTLPKVEAEVAQATVTPTTEVTEIPTESPTATSAPTAATTPTKSVNGDAASTSNQDQPQQAERISTTTYVVKQGDYLWDIAVRAYGDGYKWVEIARANELENPDVIHSGNELKLPR